MPRGVKTCPECDAENGPAAKNCKKCGFKFEVKTKTTKTKSSSTNISKADVETIFNVRQLMIEAADQGVTVEDFAESTKLKWSDLKDINTAKELEQFKKRERFGVIVDAITETEVSRIAGFIRETGNGVD